MEPGEQYKVEAGRPGPAAGREPPKGEHDWSIIVCYRLSKSEAAGSHEGMNTVLDFEHLDSMSPPVCLRCEMAYKDTVAEKCKGEPVGRLPDGRPIYHDGTFPARDEWMPQ